MRLSTRFALYLAVMVPLLVGLSGLLIIRLSINDLYAERDLRLAQRMQSLKSLALTYARREAAPAGTSRAARMRVTSTATGQTTEGVYVAPAEGDPLITGTVPASLPTPAPGPATSPDGAWRYASTALGVNGRWGRLWVFEQEAPLTGQISRLYRQHLIVTLIALAVGATTGLALGRFALRPLMRLTKDAAAVDVRAGEGRLTRDSRVPEIDELAGLVNGILDRRDEAVHRTAEALETARAFAATAAHELRTPLTSMGANIALLSYPNLPPEDRGEVIRDLASEQARVERLITMLRQLARGELMEPDSLKEVDLAGLSGVAVHEATRRHPHARIVAHLPDQAIVRGWAEGLRVIVDNLLDNAAVHGVGRLGTVRIDLTVKVEGTFALLQVADDGPGMPLELHQEAFNRFSRRAGSPGSGLGLTLIHQQVVLHGGKVEIEPQSKSRPGTGLSVVVQLPISWRPDGPSDGLSWLSAHQKL
ncbi:HAMP domain-containing histidine kinase [Planotetraspora sp. A-T 1434]|uniref:sensor histidine kinase n=1 Tax=Planotetraspora sp. A-T 1434 TaxID=2979219 RepID=UPI0021C18DA8|nr:HAMP domain-containing sensor histidine kinase [Planotetraspora sp. A-T 1434]MCT9934487.1 HAMP domain-containing histidine kinase [Planotetraspora sp. A-T 1434]